MTPRTQKILRFVDKPEFCDRIGIAPSLRMSFSKSVMISVLVLASLVAVSEAWVLPGVLSVASLYSTRPLCLRGEL